MTLASWQAQPRLKGQPLRVSAMHCRAAMHTAPAARRWPAALCLSCPGQASRHKISHPPTHSLSSSYVTFENISQIKPPPLGPLPDLTGFPLLLRSVSDSFVRPSSSAELGPVYLFNFILRHTLTDYTSAKPAIWPVSNFFPPPYFLHAVTLAWNALPNKITHSSIST